MLPSDPLNTDCDWSCEKTGVTRPAEEVKEQLAKIGMELEVSYVWLQNKGSGDCVLWLVSGRSVSMTLNHQNTVI